MLTDGGDGHDGGVGRQTSLSTSAPNHASSPISAYPSVKCMENTYYRYGFTQKATSYGHGTVQQRLWGVWELWGFCTRFRWAGVEALLDCISLFPCRLSCILEAEGCCHNLPWSSSSCLLIYTKKSSISAFSLIQLLSLAPFGRGKLVFQPALLLPPSCCSQLLLFIEEQYIYIHGHVLASWRDCRHLENRAF